MRATNDPIPHPRRSFESYAALASRLTARDRWILRMLHEHRVFTTPQLADLGWGSPITAAHRLLTLRRLGVVTRWRPYAGARSTPWHWALDALGADVIAAEKGIATKKLGYRRDSALAIFASAKLAHQVGVNGVFASLARASRHPTPGTMTPAQRLVEWWPEARCARAWGHIVQPDGYGRWQHDGRRIDFFLEYDTGTETLGRVAAKTERYHDLAQLTGIITPVLFVFPTQRRETNFRAARFPVPLVPIATTTVGSDYAAPVWAPLGGQGEEHITLVDLTRSTPSASGAPAPAAGAEQAADSAWRTRPPEDSR